jgi:cephalosporin hydroxylase
MEKIVTDKIIQGKKIISKNEFLEINKKSAQQMQDDVDLQRDAKSVLIRADEHRWIHQSSWFGEPLLNLPQDMFSIQDIIWRTRPEYIIEVGVAWGGGLLFEAMLLEVLGGKKVIGLDIFIPNNLKERLMSHGAISDKIELIEGDSTSDETIEKVKSILNGSTKTLVILDSYHTHEHVLNELRTFAEFVGKDQYLICGDTIVEHIPEQKHRPRPWGPGNNPGTAVREFLTKNDRFIVDTELENKLLLSCHPGGYLKAVK